MPLHVAALAASPAAAATTAAQNHRRRAGRRVLASPGGLSVFGGSAMHTCKSNNFGNFTNNTITKTPTPTPTPTLGSTTRAARIVGATATAAAPAYTAVAPVHRVTRGIAPRASYRSGVAVRSSSSSSDGFAYDDIKGLWWKQDKKAFEKAKRDTEKEGREKQRSLSWSWIEDKYSFDEAAKTNAEKEVGLYKGSWWKDDKTAFEKAKKSAAEEEGRKKKKEKSGTQVVMLGVNKQGTKKAKPPPPPEEDEDDEMSDDEAVGILEEVMKVHMTPNTARSVARGFADIGVDTPAKMRNLILGKSFALMGIETVAALFNGAAAVGMLAIFKSPQVQEFAGNVVLQRAAEIGLVAIGGFFSVEAFAHLVILFSFIASAVFFGTTNLEAFVDATRHLASYSSTGHALGEGGGRGISQSRNYPLASVQDAAASLRAVQKLSAIRAAIEREVESLPSAKNMDSLQRLAALFELTRAEEEDSFSPAAYNMSTEEAIRVAALFAEYDRDSDGVISVEELGALLKALGPNTGVAGDDFSAADVQMALEVLDADGSRSVNLEEFVAWFKGGCPLAKKDENADKKEVKSNIVDKKDAAAAITAAAAEEEDADEAGAETLSEINMD